MRFMGQSRSFLLASFCVEAVAVASTFRIPTVGSHYPYYILLALTFRVMVQRLLARKTTSKSLPLGPLPFRLLMPVVAGRRNGFFGAPTVLRTILSTKSRGPLFRSCRTQKASPTPSGPAAVDDGKESFACHAHGP